VKRTCEINRGQTVKIEKKYILKGKTDVTSIIGR
jgi:hypothetical protein